MRSERQRQIRGVTGKAATLTCDVLSDIAPTLNDLANLLTRDLTTLIREFKLNVIACKTEPPLSNEIQSLLQKVCDQLLEAVHSNETTLQTMATLKRSFAENWAYQLRSWWHWSSRSESADEAKLKHTLMLLFELLEYLHQTHLQRTTSQVSRAAQLLDFDLASINQVIIYHQHRVESIKNQCLNQLNEMKKAVNENLANSSWRQSLFQLQNQFEALQLQYEKATHSMQMLRDNLHVTLPQVCFLLANERFALINEANSILTLDRSERTVPKLTALETNCYDFQQKVKTLIESSIIDLNQLRSTVVHQADDQLALLSSCKTELDDLALQQTAIERMLGELTGNKPEQTPVENFDIDNLTLIKTKTGNAVKAIIQQTIQYQEEIAKKLDYYVSQAREQKTTSIALHSTRVGDTAPSLHLLTQQINALCPQVTHPNFMVENVSATHHGTVNSVLKQYYHKTLIFINNLQSHQDYLSKALVKIEEVRPTVNIPKTYTTMRDDINHLIKQLSAVFTEVEKEPNLIMQQELTNAKKISTRITTLAHHIERYKGYIRHAQEIDCRSLVEKKLDVYLTLPFANRKHPNSILAEIQKQKSHLPSKREKKIYQTISQKTMTERFAVPTAEKIVYLKERCRHYYQHLAYRGASAAKKLRIANFLSETLNKPYEVDKEDKIRTFKSQVDFFEQQLIAPRENALTIFIKSMICYFLPFEPIKRWLYHVAGVDFVNDVKSILDDANTRDSTRFINGQINVHIDNTAHDETISPAASDTVIHHPVPTDTSIALQNNRLFTHICPSPGILTEQITPPSP